MNLPCISLTWKLIPSLSMDGIPELHSYLKYSETASQDKLEVGSPGFEAQ